MQFMRTLVGILFVVIASAGCATRYVTPAAGISLADAANESLFAPPAAGGSSTNVAPKAVRTDSDLKALYGRQPASPFPANIALVRVQDSGYVTVTNQGYGHGRYSVVTARDIETDEAYETFDGLPLVSDVAPIGRILLPPNINSLRDLRVPAARLRAPPQPRRSWS